MAAPQTGTAGRRYLAAIFAVMIFSSRLDVGDCFSSALGCPFEVLSCLTIDTCNDCLNALQSAGLTVGGQDFEVCSELYAGTCATALSVGCDTTNAELVELLTCVAEDAFGCEDFTSCAAFVVDEESSDDSSSSSSEDTGAPSASTSPSLAPTSAPSSGALSPTAVPTGGGGGGGDSSPYVDTAFPSASPTGFWSFMEDTEAPSASPTSAGDWLRGGMGGEYSGSPTAAPTTNSEGVDDRSGGANGGALSATIGSGYAVAATVIVVILATASSAFVGVGSPLGAALAI